MALQGKKLFASSSIPDLNIAFVSSHGYKVPLKQSAKHLLNNKKQLTGFVDSSLLRVLTLSDHPTDVTESPSTDKSHSLVTWGHSSSESLLHSNNKQKFTLQYRYLAGACAPQVNTRAQPHTEHIESRPVHQVKIKVILQLWSIQDFKGNLGDLASWLPWWTQQLLTATGSSGITWLQSAGMISNFRAQTALLPFIADGW